MSVLHGSARLQSGLKSLAIRFRSLELENQWEEAGGHGVAIHPRLIELVYDFCRHAYISHGWIPEVTSIIRTKEEDAALGASSIHTTGRALDLSVRSIPPKIVSACKAYIDKNWQYDKMRPGMTCCYIKPHGTGPHVHLQVHPNTKRLEPTDAD